MTKKLLLFSLFIAFILLSISSCVKPNNPPLFSSIPDQSVSEGDTLELNLLNYATDPDGDALTFILISGPGTVMGSSYRYSPDYDDAGTYLVKVEVNDGREGTAQDSFIVTVKDTNRAPEISIPDQNVNEGESLTLNLLDFASDPDGDSLSFTLISGVGSISENTYRFTPGYDASSTYTVEIEANDGRGGFATDTFVITIGDVNRPPIMNDIPDQNVDEGKTLELNLLDYASDPDGDTLTFTLISGPGAITDSTYNYSPDYDASGTYIVEIEVNDGKGGSASDNFTITVNDVNRDPVMPSNPMPANEAIDISLDASLSWSCNDPDNDPLTYDIYFGTTPTPLLVASGISETTYNPGELKGNTTYYWKVVAKDNRGGTTESAVWRFTTTVLKWLFEAGDSIYSNPAIADDGTIYFGCDDNFLYAVNPDGTLKWQFHASDDIISSPAIGADGTIYVGSSDDYLYAINPDGSEKWKYKADGDIITSPAIGTNGVIYIKGFENLYALNPNGTLKWTFPISWLSYSSPAIGPDGTIYIGSYDHYLYAINPDGTEKWKYEAGNELGTPAVDENGTIYFGCMDNYLYAINPDGTEKWKYLTGNEIKSSPVIDESGVVYIGSKGQKLYAINSDGTKKWDFTASEELNTPAIASDGTIYVVSEYGGIYAINPDGTEKWERDLHSIYSPSFSTKSVFWVFTAPVVGEDGNIYIANNSNYLYALNEDNNGLASGQWPMFQHDAKHTARVPMPAPVVPYNPKPENGATDVSTDATLSWECFGPEGTILTYDIYFGTDATPTLVVSDSSNMTYDPVLNGHTTYYWKIVAKDGRGGETAGPVWSFTTVNRVPTIEISDQSVDEGKTLELNLLDYASDPDGDTLTFTLISGPGAITDSTYNYSPDYDASGTYEVTIKVEDGNGGEATDSFVITVNDVNRAPSEPSDPIPSNGALDVPVDQTLSWSCSDPDEDPLTYDIYFGTDTTPPLVKSDIATTNYNPGSLNDGTTYYWKVVAKDGRGSTAVGQIWSFTTIPYFELTITTSPDTNLNVTINDSSYSSPKTVSFAKGTSVEIGVETPQEFNTEDSVTGNDLRYTFEQWNDGNLNCNRTILITSDKTYTARMKKEFKVETASEPSGLVTITGAGWYEAGTVKTFTAPEAAGYSFDHWEIDGANYGSSNPIDLTIDSPKKVTAVYNFVGTSMSVAKIWILLDVTNEDHTGPLYSSPVMDTHNEVYVGGQTNLYRFVSTTEGYYCLSYSASEMNSSPIVDPLNNVLYVGDQDGKLLLYDATLESGTWNSISDYAFTTSPLIYNSQLYLVNYYGELYELSLSGTLNDSYQITNGYSRVWCNPAINNSELLVATNDGEIFAFDLVTKSAAQLAVKFDSFYGGFALDKENNIYIAGETLWALDKDGTELWSYSLDSQSYAAPVISSNGLIYIGTVNGTFYAIRKDTGILEWKESELGSIYSTAVIGDDGIVYVVSGTNLLAFNGNTGKLLGSLELDNFVETNPLLYGNHLYVGTESGTLFIINVESSYIESGPESIWPMFQRDRFHSGAM